MTILVYFECAEADLGKIMSALAPALSSTSELRIETKHNAPAKSKRRHTPRGSRVNDTILEYMRAEPAGTTFHYDALSHALVQVGLAPTSVTPAISQLVAEGVVERMGRKLVALTANQE